MTRAAALLMLVSANVAAHDGHGGLQGHLHGWGLEHAVLLVVVIAVLAHALKK